MSFDNPQDQQDMASWLNHQLMRLRNNEIQTVITELETALGIIHGDQVENNIKVKDPVIEGVIEHEAREETDETTTGVSTTATDSEPGDTATTDESRDV